MTPATEHGQSPARTAPFIFNLMFAGLLLWAAVLWAIPRTSAGAVLPFRLHFEWGACEERGERGILDINDAGALNLLLLASDQRTGREQSRQLSSDDLQELKAALEENSVWDLPTEIVSPEDAIVLMPGCSHLEVRSGRDQTTIDEADGINTKYFQLKSYLVDLAQSRGDQ
ncbi:hypothetical protein AUK40_00785 [Candidatus Wirthbacteria bacterium CG2_30_54_11]|uniref:Uncharacterized protein n=1 Tax=Candidatus Wirthbacteria bacterium CG2_30_54_11 TaxID=1817892 RepID=A0A1J5IPQ9_9BACT|nr:MAG: hypothetical protein AUK40_00785 [Candidatus Wirthbacteria bacterium CG2_30_54_11]